MGRASEESSSRRYRRSALFLETAKALGARVKQLRLARGWTLEHAAEEADLDLKHWQKVESADPPLNVTLVTLHRLSIAFKIPLAELFLREPSKKARR